MTSFLVEVFCTRGEHWVSVYVNPLSSTWCPQGHGELIRPSEELRRFHEAQGALDLECRENT